MRSTNPASPLPSSVTPSRYTSPMSAIDIRQGDCREVLPTLPDSSVQCVVTSPPYWGLRDYGHADQIGLEATPEEYVETMVGVFREVRRVLRDDGTLWLNLGDSYASSPASGGEQSSKMTGGEHKRTPRNGYTRPAGLKPKDLVGIPWRVARALQEPYYTGEIRNEMDRVWLAAMIDGEDCIFIHKRKTGQSNGQGYVRKNDSYGSGLEVANTNRGIVERCLAIAGKGSICTQEGGRFGRKQTLYRWNLRSNECRGVLEEVYPFLIAKQHEARLAIGCPSSGPKAANAHESLKALHHGGESGIDFPAPEPMFRPGWYLRSDIVWSKSNPMPESVTDRPTKAHEYVFLLTKSARYFFDADAVREKVGQVTRDAASFRDGGVYTGGRSFNNSADKHKDTHGDGECGDGRNIRTVWTIPTQPYSGAHFAVFPRKLVEPCLKAGTSEKGACGECGAPWVRVIEKSDELDASAKGSTFNGGKTGTRDGGGRTQEGPRFKNKTTGWSPACSHDAKPIPCVVMDPFYGAGTVGVVAQDMHLDCIGIELSDDYAALARKRTEQATLPFSAEGGYYAVP